MFTIEEIAAATGGRVRGAASARVEGVSTDSRTIRPGMLFVPLRGERFDGHDFIPGLLDGGVRAFLAERLPAGDVPPDATLVMVPDTLRALGDLAAWYRRRFSVPLVGVTGSNGKTTTKEMLASILEQTGPGLKTAGNLNNLIGVPQMLFRLEKACRWVVLEMGMSEPGEIDRLAGMAAPQVGIVLNAFPAHLESMGSVENVARAKGELLLRIAHGGTAVINGDDPLIAPLPSSPGVRRIMFGMGEEAEVGAGRVESLGIEGQRFVLRIGGAELPVNLRAFGRHNIYNALAAAAGAHALEIPLEQIRSGLESFRPYDKRFQLEWAGGLVLIDDSYNANPASMEAALDTLAELKGNQRAFVALGDMLELGDDRVERHAELGRRAAAVADRLYLCGDLCAHAAEGARAAGMPEGSVIHKDSHRSIAEDILAHAATGDLVLVKGSRGMRMENVAQGIRVAVAGGAPAGGAGDRGPGAGRS